MVVAGASPSGASGSEITYGEIPASAVLHLHQYFKNQTWIPYLPPWLSLTAGAGTGFGTTSVYCTGCLAIRICTLFRRSSGSACKITRYSRLSAARSSVRSARQSSGR